MWNTDGILETMAKKKKSDSDIIRKNFQVVINGFKWAKQSGAYNLRDVILLMDDDPA